MDQLSTMASGPIRPHFFKILLGYRLRPYLWSQLALRPSDPFSGQMIHEADLTYGAVIGPTAKMSHFQGQMIEANLTYRASWPSRPKRSIFMASVWTYHGPIGQSGKSVHFKLAIKPVQSGPFSGQAIPSSKPYFPILGIAIVHGFFGDQFDHFAKILRGRRSLPLWSVHGILGDRFMTSFCLNFTWMSLNPYLWSWLACGPKCPFSGQSDQEQASVKTLPMDLVVLAAKATHFEPPMELVGPPWQAAHFQGKAIPERTLHGASWPHGQSDPFQGQAILEASKPPFANFKCIVHGFLVIGIRPHFAKFLHGRPLRPYLWSGWPHVKSVHFKVNDPRADLYRASWPSRPKAVIFKVNDPRADLTMERLASRPKWPILRSSDPRSVHGFLVINSIILPKFYGRPLRPYMERLALGQNGPFSRSNDPGEDLTYGAVGLRPKSQFQGQTIPECPWNFGDPNSTSFCQNFTRALRLTPMSGWPSAKMAHLKSSDPDGWPTAKDPFLWSSDPRAIRIFGDLIPTSFCQNFTGVVRTLPKGMALMRKSVHFQVKRSRRGKPHFLNFSVVKTLAMERLAPGQGPVFRSNDFGSREFLVIHNSNLIFAKILRASVRNLPKAVGPHLQKRPIFEDLTYRANWPSPPKCPIFKVKRSPEQTSVKNLLWSQLGLTTKMAYFQCQTIPGVDLPYRASWPSRPKLPISNVKRSPEQTLPVEPVGPHGQNGPFSSSNDPRSRPYLWCQFALTAKTTHFLGQMIPGAVNEIFGDPEFRPHFCQHFTSTTVRTLTTERIGLTAKMAHFQGQKIPGAEPVGLLGHNGPFPKSNELRSSYRASCPSQPKGPIFKVKRYAEQSMEILVIQNLNLTFAKILLGRPLRPYLWSELAFTAIMAHFQSQTIPGVDFSYGASWPSRPKGPIFKVKRFAEQPVGPHDQNGPFSMSKDPRSSKTPHFADFQPYVWSQLALTAKTTHFLGQTIPKAEPVVSDRQNGPFSMLNHPRSSILPGHTLGTYLRSQLAFTAKASHFQGQTIPGAVGPHGQNVPFLKSSDPRSNWTSVKTLAMEPVGLHGQKGPFLRSNDLQSSILPGRPLGPCLWSQLVLTTKTSHFQGQTIPAVDFTYGASWPSWPKQSIFKVKRSPEQNSILIFANLLPGRPLGPYLWSQLALTDKTSHFQGQMIPGASKSLIEQIFNFDRIFAQILLGHSLRPYLWSQLALTAKSSHFQGQMIPGAVSPHGKNGPRSNDPRSSWTSVKTLHVEPVGLHGQKDPFSRSNDLQSREFLVIHNSDLIFASILPGRPLGLYLWSQLALTAKTSHFQGQTIPEEEPIMEPVGPHGQINLFSMSNDPWSRPSLWSQLAPMAKTTHFQGQTIHRAVNEFLGNQNSDLILCQNFTWTSVNTLPMEPNFDLIFPKILPERPLRLCLWNQLDLTAKTTHFLGQMIPGEVHGFLVIQNFDLIFSKILPGRPLRPYLWSQLALTTKTIHFLGRTIPKAVKPPILPIFTLPMKSVGPHGQNHPFSRSNDPRSHGIFGNQEFRPHFCKKFTWTSAWTLPMEPVGPNGQNVPFSRKTIPGVAMKFLVIKNSNLIFAKILPVRPLSPFYGSNCPSRPKRPIFKVKRSPEQTSVKTLPMEPVGPHRPKRPIFNVKRSPKQTLPMEPVGPQGQNVPFSRSNDLKNRDSWPSRPKRPIFKSMKFLVIRNSNLIFAKILPGRPLRPYLWSQLALTAKTAHFQGQMIPGADLTYGASWPSRPKWPIFKVKRSLEQSIEFLVIQNSNLIFAKILHGRPLRPYLWSQLALTAKTAQGQMIPGASKPPYCRFSYAIVHGFFGDPEFRPHFCQNFTWTFVKTLPMEPVGPHSQNGPFSWSNDPRSRQTLYFADFRNPDFIFAKILPGRLLRPYLWSQLALTAKTPIFKGQTIPGVDLTYGASWPSRPKWTIFKVKRSPEKSTELLVIQNFELIFAKILLGRPLGPYVRSQLALTAKTPHFQGQTIPRVVHGFLVIQNSDLIFAKILPGHPLRPYLWSQLALTPKWTIFKVKRSPKQVNPQFYQFSISIVHRIIGDPEFRPHFCQTLPGRPLGPYLRNQLALMAKTPHFQGQTIPKAGPYLWSQLALTVKMALFLGQTNPRAGIPLIFADFHDLTSGFSWPKRPIFKFKPSPEQNSDHYFCQNFTWTSVKTLPIDLVGPHGQNNPFSRSNDPRSRSCWLTQPKRPIFKVKPSPKQELTYGASWPSPPKHPIFKVKRFPKQTSVKTLSIEPVGPHGQNVPFSRSNDPRSRLYLWSQLALTAKRAHFQGQTICRPVVHGIFGDPKFDLIFAKILPGRPLRPYLLSQLALTAKTSHFQGQTIPGVGKPPFYQFSCAIVHGIFGDLEFRPHFCQNFTWTSVKTLPIDLVGPHDQNNPFSRSNDPQSSQKFNWTSVKNLLLSQWTSGPKRSIFNVKRSPEESMDFFVIWNSDLIFAKILPRRPLRPYLWIQLALTAKTSHFLGQTIPKADLSMEPADPHAKKPIFKVKLSSERVNPILPIFDLTYGQLSSPPKCPIFKNSNLIFAKILLGRPLRPYLWNQLALTAKTSHFQSQMIPGAASSSSRPKGPIFKVKRSANQDLAYGANWSSPPKRPIFKVKRSPQQTLPMEPVGPHGQNNPFSRSNDPRSRPYLWSRLALMDKTSIFKGKLSPEQSMEFSVIQYFDLSFAKILPRRPLRPYLWSQLALVTTMAHFQGQTNPETLSMEPVGPHGQNAHFQGQMIPGVELVGPHDQNDQSSWSNKPQSRLYLWSQLALTAKTTNFKGQTIPRAGLTYGASCSLRPKRPIFKVKRDPEQTSFKTLLMEQLALMGKSTNFQGQTIPRADLTYEASWPLRKTQPIIKVKRTQKLTYGASWLSRPKGPIFKVKPSLEQNYGLIFAKFLSGHLLKAYLWRQLALTFTISFGDLESDFICAKILPGRLLRPYLWSQLDLKAKTTHFHCQTIPGEGKPPFCQFLCTIVNGFFGDPELRSHVCQNFAWISIKTLPMEPFGSHGQNGLSSRSNDPIAVKPPLLPI
ncbi:hypothetical protein H5410_054491 [Solanum commersonii]|uniref:Uncharacterized protein n=1 Tax=Solanum commersonii TaxID=4109 RepID=A0A9J5WFW9_SOLCO|nr:hypothetical protein H5410_054491 [Solanum commersonii]